MRLERCWNMALWASEQNMGWVMDGLDTPQTVMTTRAPAVQKIFNFTITM